MLVSIVECVTAGYGTVAQAIFATMLKKKSYQLEIDKDRNYAERIGEINSRYAEEIEERKLQLVNAGEHYTKIQVCHIEAERDAELERLKAKPDETISYAKLAGLAVFWPVTMPGYISVKKGLKKAAAQKELWNSKLESVDILRKQFDDPNTVAVLDNYEAIIEAERLGKVRQYSELDLDVPAATTPDGRVLTGWLWEDGSPVYRGADGSLQQALGVLKPPVNRDQIILPNTPTKYTPVDRDVLLQHQIEAQSRNPEEVFKTYQDLYTAFKDNVQHSPSCDHCKNYNNAEYDLEPALSATQKIAKRADGKKSVVSAKSAPADELGADFFECKYNEYNYDNDYNYAPDAEEVKTPERTRRLVWVVDDTLPMYRAIPGDVCIKIKSREIYSLSPLTGEWRLSTTYSEVEELYGGDKEFVWTLADKLQETLDEYAKTDVWPLSKKWKTGTL